MRGIFDGLLSSGKGFNVLFVPSLKLWLAANLIAGLNDGDTIATWSDLSGNGNDGTQKTSGFMPVYKTAIVGSLPIVRFDGADDFLALPDLMTGQAAGTVLLAMRRNLDPPVTPSRAGHPLGDFGSDFLAACLPYTDGNIYDDFGTDTRKTVGDPSPSLAAWHVYEIVTAAGDWRAYLDGALLFSTASNTVDWSAAPLIGQDTGGSGPYYFDGDIGEIIVSASALSTEVRFSIRNYLMAKWGVS